MFIRIFGRDTIPELDWDSVEKGDQFRSFFEPVIQDSSKVFVRNSDHSVQLLQVEDKLYPISLGRKSGKGTCYLFSFIAQYFDYTREEVLKGSQYSKAQKSFSRLFFPLLRGLGSWSGMENLVFVNNYFLATNLYEPDTLLVKEQVIAFLKSYYPDRAIVFRSVNGYTDAHLLKELVRQGGLPLVCRQIYILDPPESDYKKKRPFKQDKKLWEKNSEFYWEKASGWKTEEINELLCYYNDLYLKKYSGLNPDYTPEFLEATRASGILDYYILREKINHRPLAVQAVEHTKGVVCTPFIGYDQLQPKQTGLYRLMNLQLTELAVKEGKVLNMSSGAADFKKQRGGVPAFDYHVVFSDHLPKRKRWFWKKLYTLSEARIKPAMKKLGI